MSTRRIYLMAVFLAVSAIGGAAHGALLTVANGDFENPALTTDDTFTTTTPPNWSVVVNGAGTVGVERLASTHFAAGQPRSIDGNQVAFLNNGPFTLSETAASSPGNLTANTKYTLTMSIGDRNDTSFSGYVFGLFTASGTPIVQESNAVTPADGTWVTRTLTYTATASDPNLGQAIFVRYGNTTLGQTVFDAVSLDATPVPEPSTSVLIAGVAAAIAARRRARS